MICSLSMTSARFSQISCHPYAVASEPVALMPYFKIARTDAVRSICSELPLPALPRRFTKNEISSCLCLRPCKICSLDLRPPIEFRHVTSQEYSHIRHLDTLQKPPQVRHLSRVLLRTLLPPVRKFRAPRSVGIENLCPDRQPAAKIHVVLAALRGEDSIAGTVPR